MPAASALRAEKAIAERSRGAHSPAWPLSRAYLAGGDDHDAADAGDAAAGFDFGDAARMAAEFAPILGGAPAGQRRH